MFPSLTTPHLPLKIKAISVNRLQLEDSPWQFQSRVKECCLIRKQDGQKRRGEKKNGNIIYIPCTIAETTRCCVMWISKKQRRCGSLKCERNGSCLAYPSQYHITNTRHFSFQPTIWLKLQAADAIWTHRSDKVKEEGHIKRPPLRWLFYLAVIRKRIQSCSKTQ